MSEVTDLFVQKMLTELTRVQSGTSSFVNGAVTFEMTKLPFAQLLTRYKADPENKDLLKMLAAAAFQDFGQRFSDFVKESVNDVRRSWGESIPLPQAAPPVNLFQQELYNHLSTILQYTIGRQLDQKQVDRLRADSNRLAESIDRHIDERASAKAQDICRLLNKLTQEGFAQVGQDIEDIKTNMAQRRDRR